MPAAARRSPASRARDRIARRRGRRRRHSGAGRHARCRRSRGRGSAPALTPPPARAAAPGAAAARRGDGRGAPLVQDPEEQLEQRGIERLPHVRLHDLPRALARERRAIRPVGHERVPHVRQCRGCAPRAGSHRRRAVGIAACRPSARGGAGSSASRPTGTRSPRASSPPPPGWRSISARSSAVERARLVQDARRHDQLAHVVQQRAGAEPEQRFVVEPAMRASEQA